MMKKLVGNINSVLMEVFMWITFIGCAIGGLAAGQSKFGVTGAVGGLVLGAIAGMLLNILWWAVSTFQEIRDYSKKWLGKTEPSSPIPIQMPGFLRVLASNGRKIAIALVSLALLAGIAGIAYMVVNSAAYKKAAAVAAEEAETGEAREVGAAKEAGAAEGGVLRDSRDGKEYKTIRIGSQTWLAGNLNLEASGSACYDNNPANCAKYGRLYSWAAAMGACPSGWRLPSGNEWERLANNAGYNPGKKLKSSEWGGADGYGFLALPGGLNSGGKFSGIGSIGLWWSATEHDAGNAMRYIMDGSHDNMDKFHNDKARLLSVRCVKD